MARCNHCQKWILGGIKEGSVRFCSAKCHENGFLIPAAESVDSALLKSFIRDVHEQPCERCNGPGPADLYTKCTATSILIFTYWKDSPAICCRRCGVRRILGGLLWSFLFGWWGFPFGLLATPCQIVKGIRQLCTLPDPSVPSEELMRVLKIQLAQQASSSHLQAVG